MAQEALAEPIVVPSAVRPRVSVIITSARNPAFLSACLTALSEGVAGAPASETIIVLNGAERSVADLVRARVRGARTIESAVHLGLAGAVNVGRSLARGELIVLLHDDAVPETGWLHELVRVADAHPEAGAIGSCMLDPDGALQGLGGVVLADGGAWPLRDAEGLECDARATDYCQSASLLVRASTWDAIGGAEERLFPAYGIDVDLGLAVWNAGQSVLCAPRSRVRHRTGATIGVSFRAFLIDRHRAVLREKWADALQGRPDAGPDPAAAVARTLAQAAARGLVSRAAPSSSTGPAATAPSRVRDGRVGADLERHALTRAVEVYEAFAKHVDDIGEVGALRREIARLHREIARRDQEIPWLHREIARRDQEIPWLHHEIARRDQEVVELQWAVVATRGEAERAQLALEAIHRGRWWRLRGRVLRVRRLLRLARGPSPRKAPPRARAGGLPQAPQAPREVAGDREPGRGDHPPSGSDVIPSRESRRSLSTRPPV